MSDLEYEEARIRELEAFSSRYFDASVKIHKVLFDDLSLSQSVTMSVFSTTDKSIYAAIESEDLLRLGDVERLVKEAGFKPTSYLPPLGHKSYFIQRAYNIFTTVYPSRTKWTPDQQAYYQLLVPYMPALVKLGGLTGSIRQYNSYGKKWQVIYEPSNRMQVAKR